MGEIRVLSAALVSRIAAGECIERPASVVKELVENALDAGAGRIDVAIEDGGRGLIQVRDDGAGMDADDLVLSVAQHATSKIRDPDDLFSIHTLGFRGEALASIAAVSRVRITSRRRDSEVGHVIQVEDGQVVGPRPCAAPPGTTVEVRDLFYSVPARRKFLRTNQTEMGHITEQLARIALAEPNVAFSLRHQGRITLQLAANRDRRSRIAELYGPELAEVLLPIRREGDRVVVEGLVAPPAESRSSSRWEYVFVNGRYVRDRFVSHAVREAYRGLIDPSRYPVAFVFITIDPRQVDVNVHPTKIEVRWQDSNYIHGQVLAALREKFLASDLQQPLRTSRQDEEYRESVRRAMVEFFTKAPLVSYPPPVDAKGAAGSRPGTPVAGEKRAPSPDAGTSNSRLAATKEENRLQSSPAEQPAAAPSGRATPEAPFSCSVGPEPVEPGESSRRRHSPWQTGPAGPPRAIQIHNAYLVVETAEGVVIIDQHALHERILYEQLRHRLAESNLESQRLLLPQAVRVPADRLEVLETHAETLARLGIELTVGGPHSVTVHALPTLLAGRADVASFVRDLLDLLSEHGSRPDVEALIHDILDMMACKAAVKAGDPLAPEEIVALLQARELADRSSHCPHGRPTTLQLTLRELERQFHRR